MNGTMKHILYTAVVALTLCFCGCTDESIVEKPKGEGTLLTLYAEVHTVANTRLSELGSAGNMGETTNDAFKDVGLYIYYQDNYDKGELDKPYIRNLRCTINDKGKLTTTENIYIYDRMTIVAFYPYNEEMNDPANYFVVKADEKAYPITESDYSKQYYIPYRAQTNVNPTNAYMTTLHFGPQQTCKVEVVLVADRMDDFPQSKDLTDGSIKLLPSVDRYDGAYQEGNDLRNNWVDAVTDFPADDKYGQGIPEGGKYVRRYTSYVWKSGEGDKHHNDYKHHDNILKKGEVLFESDKLILTVPAQVNLSEETVYRYGYNLNTGEIFIPTSDRLVYDAKSLQEVDFSKYRAYQVCDIDLSSITNWIPKSTFQGIYDGGGHKITGLQISATPTTNMDTEPDKQAFGLFSEITSESTLMNIDLVSPVIEVDFSNANLIDTCYVGALCGIVNPELSDKKKEELIRKGLPAELSEPVKAALVAERMKDFAKTTCYIRGCKVTNPVIAVKGENVRVGGLCGGAGNQSQRAAIYDSYVQQTTTDASYTGISVNAASDDIKKQYTAVYAASFCGMLSNGDNSGDKTKGGISDCYTTLEKVSAYVQKEVAGGDGSVIGFQDIAQGFCNLAPEGEAGTISVSGCYTRKADTNTGVTVFSSGWPHNWRLFKNDATVTNGGSMNYLGQGGSYPAFKWTDSWYDMGTQGSNYPTLVWEHPLILKLN